VAAAAPGKQPRDGMVFDEFFLSYRAVPNTSTLVVTRAALDAAGGWDESLQIAEDYDLSLRLAWRFPVCFIDRPLAATRMTAGSLSRGNASLYVACREIAVRNGIAAHREYFDARPELVALKWREFCVFRSNRPPNPGSDRTVIPGSYRTVVGAKRRCCSWFTKVSGMSQGRCVSLSQSESRFRSGRRSLLSFSPTHLWGLL